MELCVSLQRGWSLGGVLFLFSFALRYLISIGDDEVGGKARVMASMVDCVRQHFVMAMKEWGWDLPVGPGEDNAYTL